MLICHMHGQQLCRQLTCQSCAEHHYAQWWFCKASPVCMPIALCPTQLAFGHGPVRLQGPPLPSHMSSPSDQHQHGENTALTWSCPPGVSLRRPVLKSAAAGQLRGAGSCPDLSRCRWGVGSLNCIGQTGQAPRDHRELLPELPLQHAVQRLQGGRSWGVSSQRMQSQCQAGQAPKARAPACCAWRL